MSIYVQFYDSATGLFTGVSMHTNVTTPKAIKAFIAENTPSGHGAFVGYVGRISPEKGIPDLLAAARACPKAPTIRPGKSSRSATACRPAT